MNIALKRTAVAAAVIASLFVLGTQAGRAQVGSTSPVAFAGSSIAGSMDDSDRLRTTRAMETSPTGEQTSWRNSETGNSYSVTVTRTFEVAIGFCRDFNAVGEIKGSKETARGTACRRGDGSWNLQARTSSAQSGRSP
jgi:surface antigen